MEQWREPALLTATKCGQYNHIKVKAPFWFIFLQQKLKGRRILLVSVEDINSSSKAVVWGKLSEARVLDLPAKPVIMCTPHKYQFGCAGQPVEVWGDFLQRVKQFGAQGVLLLTATTEGVGGQAERYGWNDCERARGHVWDSEALMTYFSATASLLHTQYFCWSWVKNRASETAALQLSCPNMAETQGVNGGNPPRAGITRRFVDVVARRSTDCKPNQCWGCGEFKNFVFKSKIDARVFFFFFFCPDSSWRSPTSFSFPWNTPHRGKKSKTSITSTTSLHSSLLSTAMPDWEYECQPELSKQAWRSVHHTVLTVWPRLFWGALEWG